jgi:hypothetical protein
VPADQDLLTSLVRLRLTPEESKTGAFERGEDGVWRYRRTDVSVVGAIDVPLYETIAVRHVVRGGAPEAVLISSEEIERNPSLAWVPKVGRKLESSTGTEYEVAWHVWQEHAAIPVGVKAPERDATGIAQLAAIEERELRFARREVELRAERRARYVAIMTAIGMKRREVGECIGLSTGRVHQLLEDMPETLRAEVRQLVDDALTALRSIGPRTVAREDVDLPSERAAHVLDELVSYGLLIEDERGLRLSEAGEQAELYLRTRQKA